MTDSMITNTLNHLSNAAILSALMGGIGYLCARHVVYLNANWQIDPLAGLASGAVAGAIFGLFYTEESNTASKVVGLAGLLFVPFKLCEKLEIAISFKATLALTAATVVISTIAYAVISIFD